MTDPAHKYLHEKKKKKGKINKNKSKFDQSTLCGSRFLYASWYARV
jgi:hypothetical protein